MIQSKIKAYIKAIVEAPSADFVWSDEHNKKLFSYIEEHFENCSFDDEEIQLSVKQALRELFEPFGYLLFKITPMQLRMKLFAYKIEPKDSINLDALIDIVDKNEEQVEYDYNGKSDLICLTEAIVLKLTDFINNISNEEINKKELLKYAIREAFELKDSDIVIIKNNRIFIKLFDNGSIKEVPESQKETIANRYNGVEEEDLISFYKNFFIKDACYKDFFYFVADDFVNTYILEKKIDNMVYEKYVFAFIQNIVIENLERHFDYNKEFFKGFSGYIFRIHFKEVFGYIADLVLEEISNSNKHMIEFIKYYSLNVVVVNGQKYKVPELEAENGLKWSVSSMMSIIKIYIKTDKSIEMLQNRQDEMQESIESLYVNGISPIEYNNNIGDEMEKISQELFYDNKKLNVYMDSLDATKDEKEKEGLKKDILQIKADIQQKKDEKEKLASKLIDKGRLLKYNDTLKDIDSIKRQEKREERLLEQNRDSYLSIKNSLIKALTSKKVLLNELELQKQ